MQEKTLEEEFLELWDNKEKQTLGWYIDFISSREEKAREEGRKEERQFILNVLGRYRHSR